jgi:hypothetical protein
MPFNPNAWKQASEGTRDAEAPPDGEYDVELYDSTIITARADGRQWIKLTWTALAGAQRDRTWSSLHTIDHLTRDGELNTGLGITIESLEKMYGGKLPVVNSEDELRDLVAGLENRPYVIEVKRNGNFTNAYVRRRLEQAEPSLPGTGGYGSAPSNGPGNAVYAGDVIAAQTTPAELAGRMPERTGESDVTKREDVAAFTPSAPVKKGDIDPETGEPIPF